MGKVPPLKEPKLVIRKDVISKVCFAGNHGRCYSFNCVCQCHNIRLEKELRREERAKKV